MDSTNLPYNVTDPHATFLNASCIDMLIIEMVPMAFRVAEQLSTVGVDEDEQREAAFRRLETSGYRVGQGLVER